MKTILVDAIHAFVIKGEGVFKEMHDLLESYPNEKIVLTNADDKQIEDNNLDELPYEFFTLKHNPEKTEKEYYETLLKNCDLKADEVVYFEHNEKAVESARSVGITTLHYDKEKKDLTKLKKFIDENL